MPSPCCPLMSCPSRIATAMKKSSVSKLALNCWIPVAEDFPKYVVPDSYALIITPYNNARVKTGSLTRDRGRGLRANSSATRSPIDTDRNDLVQSVVSSNYREN
jgi:hypothetical protein